MQTLAWESLSFPAAHWTHRGTLRVAPHFVYTHCVYTHSVDREGVTLSIDGPEISCHISLLILAKDVGFDSDTSHWLISVC